jgi:hypothetical protein
MKLSPAEYDRYYQALGIHESDLLSPRDVELTDLPADVVLSEVERRSVGSFLPEWNRMDARMKIDAAQATERRVLKSRDPDHLKRLDAWTAYLLLGRVRGHEERREFMAKVARGEAVLPAPQPRKRARRPAAAPQPSASDFRKEIDARLRAKGITGVIYETTTETTADGESLTIHHLRAKRG